MYGCVSWEGSISARSTHETESSRNAAPKNAKSESRLSRQKRKKKRHATSAPVAFTA